MVSKSLNLVLLFTLRCFTDFSHGQSLLKVRKGTGISFIDLWNMGGYCSSNDNVFRSKLVDIGFTSLCPSYMYFKLKKEGTSASTFLIEYRPPFDNSLNWLTQTPLQVFPPVDKTTFQMHLRPGELINCYGFRRSGSQPNFYFAVYHPQHDTASYPKYYGIPHSQSTPVDGEIQGNEANFVEYDYLEIIGTFPDGCNTATNCQNITEEEIRRKLNQQTTITYPATSPKSPVTTTPIKETTSQSDIETEPTSDMDTTGSGQGQNVFIEEIETTSSESEMTTVYDEQKMSNVATTDNAETTKGDAETTTSEIQTTTVDVTDKTTDDTDSTHTAEDNTSTNLCPCDCEFKRRLDVLATERNIPIEELERQLEPVLQSIKKNLTVDVKTLSSTKRKKTSADDARKSSEQIGVLGAVILGVVVGLIVLVDLLSFQRHWKTLRQNCIQYT